MVSISLPRMLRSSTSASNVARSFRAVQHQNIVLIAEATVISEITSAAVQAGPKKKSVSVTAFASRLDEFFLVR